MFEFAKGREINTNFARFRLDESVLHFALFCFLEIWAVSYMSKNSLVA